MEALQYRGREVETVWGVILLQSYDYIQDDEDLIDLGKVFVSKASNKDSLELLSIA